jgi:DNA helicase-2/ATP-dependent DNA helicase PcrA
LHDFLEPLESDNAIQDSLFAKPKAVLDEKKLLELYEDRWQPDGYDDKENREKYYQKGKKILKAFWTDLQTDGLPEILFLEKNFTFKIGEGIIKGAIDRVDRLPDGTLEIIDYKTGNPKAKLEYADKRQLILYKIFLEEFLKIKVSKLSYYYLEGTYKTSFEAKDKDVEKLRSEVLEEIAEIKKGNFPPNPTELCKYCDFRDICQWRLK